MRDRDDKHIQATRRILAELADVAEASTMTGVLKGGVEPAARSYNRALGLLTERGLVPEGLFEPLDTERVDFGQIGVQCRLLLAASAEEEDDHRSEDSLGSLVALAPFLESKDLGALVHERMQGSSRIPDGLLTSLAPFLDSDTLGELVRRRPQPPTPPTPHSSPAPPPPPVPQAAPEEGDLTAIREPQTAELEALAAALRRPDLTPEERQRIAVRLAELASAQPTYGVG